jgi:hypothetical protein
MGLTKAQIAALKHHKSKLQHDPTTGRLKAKVAFKGNPRPTCKDRWGRIISIVSVLLRARSYS